MKSFITFLKIFFSILTLIVILYFVGGYLAVRWILKSNRPTLVQKSTLEKTLKGKEINNIEIPSQVIRKEAFKSLNSIKKETSATFKEKRHKPIEPVRRQQIVNMYRFMTFADDLVKKSPHFNPCASICQENTLHVPKTESDGQNRFNWLMEQYELSEEQFFKDPKVNYILLYTSNIRSIFDPDIMLTLFELMNKDETTLKNDPVFIAKILAQMPMWIYRVSENIEKSQSREKIIKSFMEMHKNCQKENLNPAQVKKQCEELFNKYE